MSGSVRSTTTAVLHSGHRYAPDAPHQPTSQSLWLGGVTVDSEMRSPEGSQNDPLLGPKFHPPVW